MGAERDDGNRRYERDEPARDLIGEPLVASLGFTRQANQLDERVRAFPSPASRSRQS